MAQTIHFPAVPRNILADEAHQKLRLLPSEFLEIPEPLTPEHCSGWFQMATHPPPSPVLGHSLLLWQKTQEKTNVFV